MKSTNAKKEHVDARMQTKNEEKAKQELRTGKERRAKMKKQALLLFTNNHRHPRLHKSSPRTPAFKDKAYIRT
jgi:hypothetical protein